MSLSKSFSLAGFCGDGFLLLVFRLPPRPPPRPPREPRLLPLLEPWPRVLPIEQGFEFEFFEIFSGSENHKTIKPKTKLKPTSKIGVILSGISTRRFIGKEILFLAGIFTRSLADIWGRPNRSFNSLGFSPNLRVAGNEILDLTDSGSFGIRSWTDF